MVTGATLRRGRGHVAIRCCDRRTHLDEVTAHCATAARVPTQTAVWSSQVDAGTASKWPHNQRCCVRANSSVSAGSTSCASCGMTPCGVSDPQVATGHWSSEPERPTAR
jgi:hypothetical protein